MMIEYFETLFSTIIYYYYYFDEFKKECLPNIQITVEK